MSSPAKQTTADFGELKDLLLEVARARGLEEVLEGIVRGIVALASNMARVCVWLGEDRKSKAATPERPIEVLRLAASAWARGKGSRRKWRHAHGDFDVVPLEESLIGAVAATGAPVLATSPDQWPGGHPQWARDGGINAYAAQPLVHRGQPLGVIAVFVAEIRSNDVSEGMGWLRIFADHAAAALANARAYEEILRLREKLEHENEYLREELLVAEDFGEIVGRSEALRKCLQQVELVAPTDATVLIEGESGTGKELVAHAVHERSERKAGPFVKVNCASVARDLFESEFFGHVRGAFTGAVRDRRGRFEVADGGTLFLDEIAEVPPRLQAKLLRVLQESTFERVGDEVSKTVDVRVIAATNRDLKEECAAGRFREDLYYRLSVFPVEIPPLRERPEDIPLLARHFVELYRRKLGSPPVKLRKKDVAALKNYDWPGNVRELQNVLQRAVITARTGTFHVEVPAGSGEAPAASRGQVASSKDRILTEEELKQLERDNLLQALEQSEGRIFGAGGAAELLDVRPTTLASRVRALGLSSKDRSKRRRP